MTELTVNGKSRKVTADTDTPLLWVLREDLGLPGTKFGCGVGLCGACTVHIDGEAVRSCQVPLSDVGARKVTTIEDLGVGGLNRVQVAWIAEQVPQCGYCQSGMVMAVTALLKNNPKPSVTEIRAAITNICRCGTYPRIVAAIAKAAG
ncbi:(2Fe-2S)-binding protein [Novosphingobium aquae]|uniref:(2Fe-2S)-binding protein n=1 Tax=Novosphingobium aquae TaxID=3133435 RepID=A0ABU8S7M9_9SPHN